jgi:hypothetical protein
MQNFKWWPWLHGYWRTLPNFNPFTVSSDPGQNLADDAVSVLLGGPCLTPIQVASCLVRVSLLS